MEKRPGKSRGGAAVGMIAELDGVEAAAVLYFRLWCTGSDAQSTVLSDFISLLGSVQGRKAAKTLEELCNLCAQHGRRPLMRHSIHCKCLGADESCFANFVAAAATGQREDAMLFATLMVRPDFAPLVTALAADFGHALRRMNLAAPKEMVSGSPSIHAHTSTVH
ncbi:hypothetical protein [Sulfitobacter donghicola]|uniref:hypothetical protein n=1 Tax=Sulfitobacter donghicola TaxID=421000 RepID=UPI0005670B3C|nr:hypothetical protein Z948_2221 [Sulfitobacter donghicola DSW-25 = KCTC 12864 = JCM 14565]